MPPIQTKAAPSLGVIEGFYGEPWSWRERADYAAFLAAAGYTTYLYAPKSDPWLRRKWREPFPEEHFAKLRELVDAIHRAGLEFGVGFTPFEAHADFNRDTRSALEARMDVFNRLGVDHLALLFDDMKGDVPELAATQADMVHAMIARSKARRFTFCPTYYSEDAILDRLFGARPADYLEVLGRKLDPAIGVFWTGPEICSKTYDPAGLQAISQRLGRPLTLWDNYPVNDGPKMCKFLHLRAFTGRPHDTAGSVASHFVNPMNQPWLSRLPLLTLQALYRDGSAYSPERAWRSAAGAVLSPAFAEQLERDLPRFQDRGWDALAAEERAELVAAYLRFDEPAAREVTRWLEGGYTVTREVFLTQ